MNTKLKVIVTAASLAALASPVMAAESNRSAEVAHASAHVRHHHVYARARITDAPLVTPGHRPLVEDCIHVTFPQCGGDGEQVLR